MLHMRHKHMDFLDEGASYDTRERTVIQQRLKNKGIIKGSYNHIKH